jgi:mannose-6-phosphate isomerase-like protein (cupin superfamily)
MKALQDGVMSARDPPGIDDGQVYSLFPCRAGSDTLCLPVVANLYAERTMTRVLMTAILVALTATGASAQNPQPSCRMCPGTYIGNEEIQQYLKRAMADRVVDQQVRSVDIGKSNVAIGLVHRGKLAEPAPASVAEHDLVSEVYHVISGAATLVLGPDLVEAKRRPADNTAVRFLNGPGHNATSIRNGVAHQLKAGDVVVIPAGTGHWFTKIDDHITYLMIRVDPDKVTPLKDEAASKADLAKK